MEEKKNGNISTLLGLIIVLLVGVIICLVIYMFCKQDTNSNNTDKNNTTDNNVINDNSNKVVTSDHITNDKVQAVYDQVKLEKFTYSDNAEYENENFVDDLYNKIVIALQSEGIDYSSYTDEQFYQHITTTYKKENYADSYYTVYGHININKGYVSFKSLNKQLKKLFNIEIKTDDLSKLNYLIEKNVFNFDANVLSLYDEYLNGFIPIDGNGDGNLRHYNSKIYNYTEDKEKIYVDTVYAYIAECINSQDGDWCAYNSKEIWKKAWNNRNSNDKSAIYTNLELNRENSYFSEEEEKRFINDKDKFTKIRYTFTKRDDGSYYVSDIKKIN